MQELASADIARLEAFLKESERVSIVVHTHPDGDALGSGVALLTYLQRCRGVEARLLLPDPAPASLGFLLEADGILTATDPLPVRDWMARSDLVFCLDMNGFGRAESMAEHLRASAARKVLIDHHLHPERESFDLVFSETEISSASELLYWVLLALPGVGAAQRLPLEVLTPLMAGMTTDTNNFANSVFPSTLRMASELLAAGVDRDALLDRLYHRYRENRAEYLYMIRDNGIGISEEFQQRMYQPFEQYDGGAEYRDGTGLGLFICKNLVELMGGTISCFSKVGEGTEFTVKMSYPLATEEQISLHVHQSETYEERVLYGKNVLVVEDNVINAEVIIEMLNEKGIHSELARDGQEAVDIYEARGEYHFQAILMDLMMPVKNGVDAAKDIRSLPMRDAEEIPIIALSADVTEDAKERVRNAGMNVLISKPIDRERLFTYLAKEFAKTDWTEND